MLKKIKKSEKGSITILVLTTMLVVVGVIFIAFFSMMNKSNSQERELDKIQEEYNKTDDIMSQAYDEKLYVGWNEEKGCNEPEVKDSMELVKWDEEAEKFVPDETNSSYDYNNQQWANAVVTLDGVESYFVWIPRYAYKINYTTPGTPSNGGTIDIKFLKGMSNIASDGTVCKYANDENLNKEKDYIIHPAFTNDVENGGWDSELPGIWVGKYESSRSDSEGRIQGISTTIKIQPGVTSWRTTTIGEMYNYAKTYSTNLNSHMLKNSEWGAVAYLTESKYGRDGTGVTINDNIGYITADEGISANPEQSSTGNETGIYDLSGGAFEYAAAYYNGSSSIANGSSFANRNETSTEYATAYTGTSASSAYKPGDATYETSGWHGGSDYFVSSDYPFFTRGGDYSSRTSAGVFSFGRSDGFGSNGSFRVCLAVK